ncbi:hypothetical protein D5086_005442 [Populus alba]|uniref:Uncharacterized protein n=1 Tax=Populus alba TaxID=43335 RepID=A0ACC4CUU0_POPAL
MSSNCYSIQTIVNHLKHCTKLKQLQSMYAVMVKTNTNQDCYLMNQFISALSTFNRMDYAVLAYTQMENPNVFVYNAMIKGNLEIAQVAANKLMVLEPGNSGYYTLMVNMNAEVNRWGEAAKIRLTMKEQGVEKRSPGSSWIEMESQVHQFAASDKTHAASDEIYSLLAELDGQMKLAGYVPELCIFFGTLFSNTFLVYIQDNVGWTLGYALPTLGLAVSIIVFLVGTPFYRHKLPAESPLTRMAQVLVAAVKKWKVPVPDDPKQLHELSLDEYIGSGKELTIPLLLGMMLHVLDLQYSI